MHSVTITKATTTDAFTVIDLVDAPSAVGVVRCARKILTDGAVNLARTLTYTYASFGEKVSGASAGINAEGDARDEAVKNFVTELGPQVEAGSLRLSPAKGVTADDLAAWPQPPAASVAPDRAVAISTTAAAAAVRDLTGANVVVEAGAPGAESIAAAFADAGATATVLPLAELLTANADVVVVGSKNGVLDHNNVSGLGTALIIGAAGLAITARGLATAKRQGATVLADFVTAAGPALAGLGADETAIAERVRDVVTATLNHDEGPYLGACYAAEDFLRTWTDELPFGRPMAS